MFLYLGGDQYINTDAIEITHIQLLGNKIVITGIMKYVCETATYIVEFLNHDDAKEQLSNIIRQLHSLAREKAEKQCIGAVFITILVLCLVFLPDEPNYD